MDVHHEQRMRGTVPSYGQALALGNLMEQMHLEVRCNPLDFPFPRPPREFLKRMHAGDDFI